MCKERKQRRNINEKKKASLTKLTLQDKVVVLYNVLVKCPACSSLDFFIHTTTISNNLYFDLSQLVKTLIIMMSIDKSTVHDQCFQADVHDLSPQRTFLPADYSLTTDEEALQKLKSFLKQHPWSVSDPGLPSSRVEHPSRAYISSPLLKGGFEGGQQLGTSSLLKGTFQVEEQHRDQGNKLFDILKIVRSKTLANKSFFKWVFTVLNVLLELWQATLSQEKNEGKMGRQNYLKLSIITSLICSMIALFETFHEGKRCGVVWKRRGNCCWFFYPGNEGRLFGRFSLYFGLISSMVQLIINLIEEVSKKDVVQFDYLPLLLAICYLVATMVASREMPISSIMINCNVHGISYVESTLVEGYESRVFQCPECQIVV